MSKFEIILRYGRKQSNQLRHHIEKWNICVLEEREDLIGFRRMGMGRRFGQGDKKSEADSDIDCSHSWLGNSDMYGSDFRRTLAS